MDELIELDLARVVLQEKGDNQYLHLREKAGERSFPILIGFTEAAEINRKLRGTQMPRPMTHDLIGRVLESTGWTLRHVVINELRETTFFAQLVLGHTGATGQQEERLVDCRPSDAIALAVQAKAKIFVARKVLDLVAPG